MPADQAKLTAAELVKLTPAEQMVAQVHRGTQMAANHVAYLKKLKANGFEPKVAYDIGASALHWTREVKKLWPRCRMVLFDAHAPAEFLYKEHLHYVGVLSDTDHGSRRFYSNDDAFSGNSYYREVGSVQADAIFPETSGTMRETRTLDSVVQEFRFPRPDLVKIDVQGAEIDILHGGKQTLSHAKHLLVELQHTMYNKGAPLAAEAVTYIEMHGWKCIAPAFSSNGPFDADYGFERVL